MSENTWEDLVSTAVLECSRKKLSKEHIKRLKFEINEIGRQGANNYWTRLYDSQQKFDHNKNGLVFPFLLGITTIDPVDSKIEHIIKFDPEFPDIDVDLLPESRDPIKKYAEEKYGQDYVCNIGLWLTYKAKLALQDATSVLGYNRHEAIAVCKNLPEEFDEMPFPQAYDEFEQFRAFADDKPEVVELAYKMMGKIKSQGKHAGGLIISNVPIRDFIPLTKCGAEGNKQWTSAWTEGMAASQLSKFGFIKFDLLGLLNISYIYNCKKLIRSNRRINIEFDDIDPKDDRAGWMIYEDGDREKISLNDPLVIENADKVKLESIFQFDTDFAKSIVEKGGVKSFYDLLSYTSLGRPGPLPMLDVYIKNRDDPTEAWKDTLHPKMLDILKETKGVLCIDSETLVRTSTGRDRYIKDLNPGDMIMSYCSKTRTIEPQPIVKIGQTRTGDGVIITTDDHRQIITTDDHEFVCYDGSIKKAYELTKNDLIPVPVTHEWKWNNESLDIMGYEGNNDDWAYLFGYIVGDGLLTQTSPTICCGNDEEYTNNFDKWLRRIFGFETSVYWHCRSWYIRIKDSNPIKIKPEFNLNPYVNTYEWWQEAYDNLPVSIISKKLDCSNWWARNKLKQHKIVLKNKRRITNQNRFSVILKKNGLRCNVYTKRVPEWIFNSTSEVAKNFLAGLLDADGCVTSQDSNNLLSFISVNKALLNDVSKLLNILSIEHNFQKDRIFIWGQDVFKKAILPLSFKHKFWNDKFSPCNGESLGWVPRSILLDKAKKIGSSKRALDRKGILYRGHWRNSAPPFCKSSTARKVGIDLGQVRFQKIKSIKKIQNRVYYGIEVDKHHTLIGNGIIVHNCFQEQLLRIWVEVCGFTMPEAEAAQKAVKKKRVKILNEIEPRVISGASSILGEKVARELWDNMISFGRYCFNKSHAVAYMIIAYRCLWLKTHFPAEWWAAVLSECPNKRTVQYMGAARAEGIAFGSINVNSLTAGFSVNGDQVTPGVMGVKGIGKSVAKILVAESKNGPFTDLDNFVSRIGKNKTATERLVKLGGFDSTFKNRRAMWMWYIYNYDTTTEANKTRKKINSCYTWPVHKVEEERQRQMVEYQRLYPKRKKIPSKILKWVPSIAAEGEPRPYDPSIELSDEELKMAKKIKLNFDQVARLFPKNFNLKQILQFEKEYLGYYWNSPVDMFIHGTNTTIEEAKTHGLLECVVEEAFVRQGARGDYMILNVTDGINAARVNIWGNEVLANDEEVLTVGTGIKLRVNWQDKWRSFALKRGSIIIPLALKEE